VLYGHLCVLELIPRNWEVGEMQLGYKKGDKMSVSHWRLITLLYALYKLFRACFDRRLHAHDKLLKVYAPGASLFSINQRGFRPRISGCKDIAALLRRLGAVAQRKGASSISSTSTSKTPFHPVLAQNPGLPGRPRAQPIRRQHRFRDNKRTPALT
jgi:hypothetical protein